MTLHTHTLSVRLNGKPILQDISIQARQGEITALAGPNGSGKTTLLRTLAGLLPYQGTIAQNEQILPPHQKPILLPHAAYLPQDCSSSSRLTALDVVLLGRLPTLGLRINEPDYQAAYEAMQSLDILTLANHSIGSLSGGQRQLVFLAQTLARKPKLLLLDEPISALDIHYQLQVMNHLKRLTKQYNLTTIIILHDLNAALQYAQRTILLRLGHVHAQGPSRDILQPMVLEPLFGVPMGYAYNQDKHPTLVIWQPQPAML